MIKALAVSIALSAASFPSGAATREDFCQTVGNLAKEIMSARQAGLPMQGMMKAVDKAGVTKESEATKLLVIAAYERPRYSTEEVKSEVITEFQNKVFLECVKAARQQ